MALQLQIQEPFQVNNNIDTSNMSCKGFCNYSLQDIIDSFGENNDMKWKISTYFNKDMLIIFNSLIKMCFIYGNNDITNDNINDILEYININVDTLPLLSNDIEEDSEEDNSEKDDSEYEDDSEEDSKDTIKALEKTNYSIHDFYTM